MNYDPRRGNFRVPPAQPFAPLPGMQPISAQAEFGLRDGDPDSQYLEDFAIYEVDFLNLAAATIANGSVRIQADSYFKWMTSCMTVDDDAAPLATIPNPLITMQIIDGGSNLQLFSDPVPVNSIFGFGQLPFVLPVPRIFNPNSLITLQVANYSDAQQVNARFSLIGCKIYKLARR